MLDCKATDRDGAIFDPRFGGLGKQTIRDTSPLTKKRTGTINVDVANRAVDYIKWQAQAGKPFFLWANFTHIRHRVHRSTEGRSCRISELALKTNAETVIRSV